VRTKGKKEIGREVRLGGIAEWLGGEITARTGKETRSIVLGHLQRGGGPTAFDRLMALRFGTAAIRALAEGAKDVMVALRPPSVVAVPLSEGGGGQAERPAGRGHDRNGAVAGDLPRSACCIMLFVLKNKLAEVVMKRWKGGGLPVGESLPPGGLRPPWRTRREGP
jgi:hypothetical protein